MANWFDSLERDLQSPLAVRRLGSGWFSGFFALLLSTTGLCLVMALRWPDWFATPELAALHAWGGLRPLVHALLIGGYALALLSLLLRTRKAIGATALIVALLATLLGGAEVQPRETHDWGVFFGVDFFAVNMVATGLMFAPIERLFPHRAQQRLFRQEWREDLFYYLISSMMVQLITFLALAPSSFINANTAGLAGVRAMIAGQPWLLQFLEVVLLTDFVQYWFHRAFHRVPFLWGFHAVHHSARSMDWLAGARMHFFEIIALRGVTSLPLLTFGFSPSVMQAYIGFVYIYSSLLHANLRGDFNHLGRIVATPRFHHWHHAIEEVAVDKNFAIHFPFLDRLFGTHHLPDGAWPTGYGVPEQVPQGYRAQFLYPFRRKRDAAL
ncbi:sterol desaturase family protein [Sphingobium indicum]|uniref:Sterol desaturase n=2 Tax=Sphingobium indicum TaxID=332055 RepID=A0A1L5BUP0_SPHIB|nr:sterol desaturase family protein [Sphingobium indicum]APL96578.1 sterol desaturase [Sphingobium indicum B90A]KEY97830.1 sterol desaturase [Sphingomonas sp. BHC-A]NYI23736.1 sterol desaturase/sphingolipid hydroxylase (fatty acid hydroxylase superfamily) [Sphingobium indicum]RYM00404.1 sterol desaturase family protein [Sphingobium indicum]